MFPASEANFIVVSLHRDQKPEKFFNYKFTLNFNILLELAFTNIPI